MFFEDINPLLSRRLPVYLLLDTSASMAGEKINALNEGLRLLYSSLLDNPQAVDTVWMAVINFGTQAHLVVPLTDVMNFSPPTLTVSGATSLGKAVKLVHESINRDVRNISTETVKGDYRPLVFIMTDGKPTDDYAGAFRELREHPYHPAQIVILVIGDDSAVELLRPMGDVVLAMRDVTSDALTSFFSWISVSVAVVSKKAPSVNTTHQVLVQAPEGVESIS